MLILVVESDPATSQSIELMLRGDGHRVPMADTGDDAIAFARDFDLDLITLDLALPDMSGFEVLRRVRAAKIATPIIVVSGIADIESKVKAFGHGADDYLTKPFHRDELLVRIHAIVRRSKGHAQSIIVAGDLAVNIDQKTAEVAGRPMHLTGQEYHILELLALRKGSLLTKEMFLNHLYGGRDEPETKVIEVFICKLRKKLTEASGGQHFIETVWGRGYILREPERCPPIVHHKPAGVTRAVIAAGRAEANAQ